jgi:hypothetical protein
MGGDDETAETWKEAILTYYKVGLLYRHLPTDTEDENPQ